MAGTVNGGFNFPGQEPVNVSATGTLISYDLKQSKIPKIYFSKASFTIAGSVNSQLCTFFRVTLLRGIKIYKVYIAVSAVTSAGAFRSIDQNVVQLSTLGGATFTTTSQFPGTYGSGGSGITTNNITYSHNPLQGGFVLDFPMQINQDVQWQFTSTAYGSFALNDVVTFAGYILWDFI